MLSLVRATSVCIIAYELVFDFIRLCLHLKLINWSEMLL